MSSKSEQLPSVTYTPIVRPRNWSRFLSISPAILFLGFFFIYPVVLLLGLSFVDSSGTLTLEHYTRLYEKAVYVKVLLITLKIAGWTTIFSILAGYPIAYLLSTVKSSTRNSLVIWVLMPFWTSFLVRTFAWIVLLGRHGALNELLLALGIVDAPVRLIFNFTGVMIGMVHALMPLCVLTMMSVMENIDRNLVSAASTLGARGGQAFWRIYFPLSAPGVAAGGMLVFITSLGFFITPALLGGARDTMIVQVIIFQIHEVLNWGFAGAIAMLLLASVLVIFFFYDQLLGLSTLSGESTHEHKKGVIGRIGRWLGGGVINILSYLCEQGGILIDKLTPLRTDRKRRQGSRTTLWITAMTVIAFLCIPALFVIPVSFTEDGFLGWPPVGFSLQWYEQVLNSPAWAAAASRSFVVAISSALLGMSIGVPAAFFLARRQFFGKAALFAFLVSPIIMPNIIIAVALFYLYAKLGLVGTNMGLILGHTILAIPYVVITVMAILKNYDHRLDQAAWTLGANKWQTLTRITLPLLSAGLIAAFMFAFVISFDELTIALFVTGGEVTTLPKQMWDDALMRVSPALAAVATLLLAFMSCIIFSTEYVRRRGLRK
ncbi:MAG: ABC transporter permease subunit [Candidatus Thioglobus sp.]|jgi:ABC-type spermidine/putrescine transport system permease subunit I|nr:ABC transporter permease subunit [Candidatus Thioglobus sp.]